MEVSLVDKMGTDLTVVNSARVSYAKTKTTFDAKDEKFDDSDAPEDEHAKNCALRCQRGLPIVRRPHRR